MARTFKSSGLGIYGERVIMDADFTTPGRVKQSGNVGAHDAPYQATVETFDVVFPSGVTSETMGGHPGARFASGHGVLASLNSFTAFNQPPVYSLTATCRFKLDSLTDCGLILDWPAGVENFYFAVSAAGAIGCGVKEGAGGGYLKSTADGVISAGVEYTVSFTVNPAVTLLLSVNGATVALSVNVWVSSTANGSNTTLRSDVAFAPKLGDSLIGFMDVARLQTVVMTQAELNALTLDPHQVYVDAEGGGGSPVTVNANLGSATAAGLVASIIGAVTIACSLGAATASGQQASVSTGSNVTISATLGTATASGYSASVVSAGSATITTDVFKNNTGTVLASTVIPKLAAIKLSDMTLTASWTNQSTNGSGILSLTGALTAATDYLLVVSSADGAAVGIKKYTAT